MTEVIQVTEDCEISIELAEDATANIVVVQIGSDNVNISQRSKIAAGATLNVHNITLGSGNVEQAVINELAGDFAKSSLDWIFYAKGNEHYKLSAQNIFNGPNGGGEINLKGVAQDQAHIECDGLIDIGLEGQGTDTYLTEEVLMLDPTAQVEAVPGLEIKTNDVKASHSATVSRVNQADLFYFASRGIPQTLARKMYVEGFLGDLTLALPDKVQESVLAAIDAKYMNS